MINSKPFFSVIIPTYNRAEKLKATLQSVIDQRFTNFEILVVDDGSVDSTEMIVDSFHDERISYFWMKNSGGPAAPRNRGIDLARADWICFLDADDIWYPQKLTSVYEVILKGPGINIICHNEIMHKLKSGKRSLLQYGPYENDFYRIMLKSGNRLSTSATTVNRFFLNQHNLRFNQSPDYVIVEDFDLWLRIALNGGKFHFIDDPLGEYIIEDDNISSDVIKLKHNSWVLIKDHVYLYQNFEPNRDKLFCHIKASYLMSDAKEELSLGHCLRGISLISRAFSCSPVGVVTYISTKLSKLFGFYRLKS